MPPRLKLMAQAPVSQMETRAKNKTSHPGYVDLPHPPNPDKPKVHKKTAEEKAQEETQLIQAAKNVAGIQDTLAREDAVLEASRRAERAVNEAKGKHCVIICDLLLIVCIAASVGQKISHKAKHVTLNSTDLVSDEDNDQRKFFENLKDSAYINLFS